MLKTLLTAEEVKMVLLSRAAYTAGFWFRVLTQTAPPPIDLRSRRSLIQTIVASPHSGSDQQRSDSSPPPEPLSSVEFHDPAVSSSSSAAPDPGSEQTRGKPVRGRAAPSKSHAQPTANQNTGLN